jgi:hypothetical protein
MRASFIQYGTIPPESQTKLYEHSTQCAVALNVFLRCQPIYWCFVPITVEQAMADDSGLTSTEASILMEGSEKATADSVSPYHRPPSLIHWCLRNVPLPPSTHQFSLRQRIEQYGFFRDRLDLFPTRFLDLYNAAMVMTSQYAHLHACMLAFISNLSLPSTVTMLC